MSFLANGIYQTVDVVFVSCHSLSGHLVHHLILCEAGLRVRVIVTDWCKVKSPRVDTLRSTLAAVLILDCQWEHDAFSFLFLMVSG